MWPWEHAAVGYVLYSLWRRRVSGRGPGDAAVLALIVGTQFPDLVDKPLAWGLGVLPSGQSLAHSLLFALPVVTVFLTLCAASGRRSLGTAFGVGYVSHLLGDVAYPVLWGDPVSVSFLLYPVTEPAPYTAAGLLTRVWELFADFTAVLTTPAGTVYLLAELALVTVALALWVGDGMPVVRAFGARVRRADTG